MRFPPPQIIEEILYEVIPNRVADSLAADPWRPIELAGLYRSVENEMMSGTKAEGVLEAVKRLLFSGYIPREVSPSLVKFVEKINFFVMERQERLGVEPYSLSGHILASWVGRYYNFQRRGYLEELQREITENCGREFFREGSLIERLYYKKRRSSVFVTSALRMMAAEGKLERRISARTSYRLIERTELVERTEGVIL